MSKVALISYTKEPEFLVAAAAKLCYSDVSIEQIQDNLTKENTKKFIDMLMDLGHESPIEHISFTFGIEGVSRSLLAQLTRHRIASYSVQSQRYVKENKFEFVIPPQIESNQKAKEEFLKAMDEDIKHYEKITNILKTQYKEELKNSGIEEKRADSISEKKAIEDARFVLPNACATQIICTFNARSLLNFFSHRCCSRAQWEIREVATEMLSQVLKVAPEIFRKAGPPCVRGDCPEGKMSCGKTIEIREKFLNLRGN
ncbi:MAG: Flavin-dependent thymidylate synthase [Eubacteriales bacterium SKADARSKE-1]|nr:Flavin-dependent thymidylate synthase [Eubacteriales bacterium SKADARSKE-1]